MINFKNYITQKVLSESASQKHHIMTKRPTPFFQDTKSLRLPNPPRLLSKETQTELQEVRDAMIMSDEKLQYEKKLDVDFMEMMKDIVDRGKFDVYLVDELKRQIDTLTLRQKYHFNRTRPREAATFYNQVLTPYVKVDTPSYPSNHAVVGFVIAEVLGRRHPDKMNELMRVAQQNADSRVSLGVHFPLDIEAGRDFADQLIARYITQEPIDENKKLKFKGKEMKDHLDKAKKKLVDKYGSLTDVDYGKAMKVVGATLAARLAARGMIKRSSGKKEKGKLGKK